MTPNQKKEMEAYYNVVQSIILFVLAAGTFFSWRLVYCGDKMIVFLAVYLSINLASEYYVKKLIPGGMPNHYVYAANILLHTGSLLAYIFIQPQRNIYRAIPVLSFAYFGYWYFSNNLWKKTALFSMYDFINYYGILSVCSIVWVWITVRNKTIQQQRYELQLAVCFLLYHVLGLVNNSLSIVKFVSSSEKQYIYWATTALVILFYSFLAGIFIKMLSAIKSNSH